MIIKKFLAKSEKAAIEMAKNELGNNAIVMNIKKVKPKGLAKLFVRGKVEVTAALDETPLYAQEEAAKEKRPVEAGKFSETEKKADAPDPDADYFDSDDDEDYLADMDIEEESVSDAEEESPAEDTGEDDQDEMDEE